MLSQFRRYLHIFHAYTRRRIHALVKSQAFYWIVILLVLMNTVVLATEYYGQPPWLTETQGIVNCSVNIGYSNLLTLGEDNALMKTIF